MVVDQEHKGETPQHSEFDSHPGANKGVVGVQNSRELELKAADTVSALALLTLGSPGTLRVLRRDGLGVGQGNMMLLTGAWVAYAENWLCLQ